MSLVEVKEKIERLHVELRGATPERIREIKHDLNNLVMIRDHKEKKRCKHC